MAKRNLILIVLILPGCYSTRDEHVLVLDSVSHRPVEGVGVYKKAARTPFYSGVLPKASEAVSDSHGKATLRVPKDWGLFIVGVKSNEYEQAEWQIAPATKPSDVDEIYYVRPRSPTEQAITERMEQ